MIANSEYYLVKTRMKNHRGEGLLVDPGSPSNLCGDEWVKRQAAQARAFGMQEEYAKLQEPLEVGGIGTGSQSATSEVRLPIALTNGKLSSYAAPMLPNSSTPALLGQRTLKETRSLIDCYNKKLIHVGVGGYKIELSPGSESYDLEESHAGHLMLPCSEFEKLQKNGHFMMSQRSQGNGSNQPLSPIGVSNTPVSPQN